MSASDELQELVYLVLSNDGAVVALVGDRIYDRVPKKARTPYISFGPSDTLTDDADCMPTRVETLQIDVWSEYQGGKSEAKRICDAVKACLHDQPLEMTNNALEHIAIRQVQVFDDADGVTVHGVVNVEATIREY